MATKKNIILHHSATTDNPVAKDYETIRKNHMAQGWRDIGYNWVLEKVNGIWQIIEGRSEALDGAHCIGRNTDSIGVCVVGNYDIAPPDTTVYGIVAKVCQDIMTRHPIEHIGGHKEFDATACPGRYFEIGRVKNLVVAPPALHWADKAISKAMAKGIADGTRPDGPATRAEVWTMFDRLGLL